MKALIAITLALISSTASAALDLTVITATTKIVAQDCANGEFGLWWNTPNDSGRLVAYDCAVVSTSAGEPSDTPVRADTIVRAGDGSVFEICEVRRADMVPGGDVEIVVYCADANALFGHGYEVMP